MKPFPFSHPFRTGTRFVLLFAILLMNFGSTGTSVAYAAPPAHDDFDAAKTIDTIEYHDTVNTREATPSDTVPNDTINDPDQFPCQGTIHHYGFATVWYKYTPPETQSLSLDTIPTLYDTFIAVWTGTKGNLTFVACNDESFEGFSELSFTAQAGTTYYIEVAQYNDGTGSTSNIGGDLTFNAYVTNTTVRIGKPVRGRYFVPDTTALRRSFINLNAGPVEIFNVAGNQFVASERIVYKVNGIDTSFSELMGLPARHVDKVYWMPWYNSKTLNSQLDLANISKTVATVRVKIGNRDMAGSPYKIPAGATLRKTYPNLDTGPVKIISNVPIVASQRVFYQVNGVYTSASEMMGMPNKRLDRIYWLPWYNSKTLNTQLLFANVSTSMATIRVYIGKNQVPGSPFALAPGKSIRKSYANLDRGPVKIVSSVKIAVSERVIYRVNGVPVSYTEMMGLPNSQVDKIHWLPVYNSKGLDTQLRFANASTSTATIHVTIAGQAMPGTPFTLPVGTSIRKSFPGIDNGPVKITSNVNIAVSERVIYRVNGKPTSFSEMMALPNKALDSRYWMPWYNNLNLNTQLRFALP